MMKAKALMKYATAAMLLACAGSIVLFALTGNKASLMPALFALLGIGCCSLVHEKKPMLLDANMCLAIQLFIFFSSLMGSSYGWYDWINHYDDYLHVGSGVLTCILAFSLLSYFEYRDVLHVHGWVFPLLFAVAFVMGLGALWEIYEFLSDLLLHTNMQAGGNLDTMVDLLDATLGMAVAYPFCFHGWQKKKKP